MGLLDFWESLHTAVFSGNVLTHLHGKNLIGSYSIYLFFLLPQSRRHNLRAETALTNWGSSWVSSRPVPSLEQFFSVLTDIELALGQEKSVQSVATSLLGQKEWTSSIRGWDGDMNVAQTYLKIKKQNMYSKYGFTCSGPSRRQIISLPCGPQWRNKTSRRELYTCIVSASVLRSLQQKKCAISELMA